MKFISLFSGVGGFDRGFENASMECVAQVENDKQCMVQLEKHWPGVAKYSDVRKVTSRTGKGWRRYEQLPKETADLICGGFPCQDVSVAGKRAGLAGERSGLWFEFHRIIEEHRPGWVVIENVPGLLSSQGGRDFAVILRGLAELGYGVSWRILDSQYFGVAQRRRRVFIVGSLGNGRSAEVLFECSGSARDTAPSREKGKEIARSVATRVGQSHREDTDTYVAFSAGQSAKAGGIADDENITPPLKAGNSGTNRVPTIAFNARRTELCPQEDVSPALNPGGGGSQSPGVAWHENQAGELQIDPNGISKALKANASHNYQGVAAWEMSHADEVVRESGDIAPTLQKRMGTGGNQVPMVGVRRLTPTECERLQGFPDGWTSGQSDSARYKQLGNAVTVNVAEWIGRRIMEAHNEPKKDRG